jgi:ferrous iron transport protein A
MQSSPAFPAALPLVHCHPERSEGSPSFALDAIKDGAHAQIVALDLEVDFAEWLRAVGIHEGERVTVLRRALLGGPIHVRTGSGGEFALNRSLAQSIRVIP